MNAILDEVERQKNLLGEHMQPPCTEESIASLTRRARQEFGIEPPGSYLNFLRRTDGLDFNGTVFFASVISPYRGRPDLLLDGFIEANRRLREVPEDQKYLIFGESGMEMYVMDLVTRKFDIVDQVSTDIYESFDSFEDLLEAGLRQKLLKGL